ncbi:F-box protein 9 [Rhizophagus clarus]|uniref:F-box protein 9 n=1 Tax=Rhizophagus clarus TaxID=94130 RepID=A0A8H3QK63_9GLOM|nr:F-box protein 9 [Rhizophagus clarus]
MPRTAYMESDLESFRQQWQQEILQQRQQKQVLKEDNVSIITNKIQDASNLGNSTLIPVIEESNLSKNDGSISFLINSFCNMTFDLLPLNPTKKIHISKLPNELLICILKQLILAGDVNSLENGFALVCKKFFLLSRDSSIWHLLCERIYNVDNHKELVKMCVNTHGNDWRRMYIERPRVRLDGVYISKCKYLRPGLAENTWIQPTHLVTYYRYLRFFSDGSCITLLTTKEPIQVVKNFDKIVSILKISEKSKNFMIGYWKFMNNDDISSENQVIIRANDNGLPKFTFHLKFDLKSTSIGKFNKLSWIEYYSVNNLTTEKTELLLKNESNYYFSKVKSQLTNLWFITTSITFANLIRNECTTTQPPKVQFSPINFEQFLKQLPFHLTRSPGQNAY